MNTFRMLYCGAVSVKYLNGTSLLHVFFSRVLTLIPNYSKLQVNV